MQPVQDLSIEDRVSRTQYQYTLRIRIQGARHLVRHGWCSACTRFPSCATWRATSRTRACGRYWIIDRSTASRLGLTPQMIDDTLYDAFGQRLVSTIFTELNQYRVILEVKPRVPERAGGAGGHLRAIAVRQSGAPERDHPAVRADRPALHQSPGPVPGRDRVLQPGARRVARRGGAGHRSGPAGAGHAGQHPGSLSGGGGGVPRVARQRADPDPGSGADGVYRAGCPLRELHPSDHDPVDAAVRRDGRVARADADADRPGCSRGDRHHPVDRHRHEERHHDDRLRAGGGAPRRQAAARGDLSGVPAALPADLDDYAGGAAGRAAAGTRRRRGRGAAQPAGHRHRRRLDRESAADALHHAGDLPGIRSAGAASGAPRAQGSGSAALGEERP